MNWIFSILFYIFIFSSYRIIGRFFSTLLELNNNYNSSLKEILTGYIITFFLGFVIGFPSQVLHVNWNVFRYLYLISYAVVLVFCFYKEKEYFKEHISKIHKLIYQHLKNNWLIYSMALVFILFAVSNVLVYYQNNYDDAYYLSKIVNSIGCNSLATENSYNGAISFEPLFRMVNTYEITYGFFSQLFHISVPFFCRFTMSLHNYVLVFSVYKLLAQFFVKKELSQYCVLPFILLLIPSGYMMDGNLPISLHMYDGWQFQTAMFYGGSVVRTMALPVIFIFTANLIKKMNYKNVLFIMIIYITFMSFSTVFLIYAVIVTLVLFMCKGIIMYQDSFTKKIRDNATSLLYIFIPAVLLLMSKLLDKISFISTENFYNNLVQYTEFSNRYFFSDTLTYYALAILIFVYFVYNKKIGRFITLVMIVLFIMIFSNCFKDIIIISSGFYGFVGLRFVTSIQMLVLFFSGLLIVYFIQNIKYRHIIASIFSITALIIVPLFMIVNIENIKQINWLGSGITAEGYTLDSIRNNDEMMPDIMCEVGEYFNHLPYDNYTLLLPAVVNWDNYHLQTNGFVFASNRIELCTYGGAGDLSQDDLDKLYLFLSKENQYENVELIIQNHNIQYILLQNVEQKNVLLKNGWTLELSSDKINKTYYLLKRI